jgi:hypothetical protein
MVLKHRLLAIAASCLIVSAPAFSQTATSSRTKTHVQTLASDKFEGRLTGSPGEKLAADYLIAELKRMGAKPLPGMTDFRMPFTFTAGSKDGGSTFAYKDEATGGRTIGTGNTKVLALSFSDSGSVSGPVVFAGYGLVVPDSQNFGYDSYQGLDVKDKIVVVLRYFPEDADQKTRAILARYADLRYKAQAARQRGAKGMIVVTGPRSPNAGNVVPMSFDTAIAGSGLVAVSISGDTAAPLFKAANKQLEAVQMELDGGNPHVAGFAIPNLQVTLDAKSSVSSRPATTSWRICPQRLRRRAS